MGKHTVVSIHLQRPYAAHYMNFKLLTRIQRYVEYPTRELELFAGGAGGYCMCAPPGGMSPREI